MPAVTTRFDMTKHDIRNGKKTGNPVSVGYLARHAAYRMLWRGGHTGMEGRVDNLLGFPYFRSYAGNLSRFVTCNNILCPFQTCP